MRNLIRKILLEEQSQSNLDRLVDYLGQGLNPEYLEGIKDYIKFYIREGGFTVKFLNSCRAGFSGVRTKKQIIICSPTSMSLGDFIYIIFHEIRHEIQMTTLNMGNPLIDMSLDEIEELSEKYWEMEVDADNTAKENVARMVLNLNIPIDLAKKYFQLSSYIEGYQIASNMVKSQIKSLAKEIDKMRKDGLEVTDIEDHPMVKQHLEKLEDFI